MRKFKLFVSLLFIAMIATINAYAVNNELSDSVDYDIISLEMRDLQVQPKNGFEALKASDKVTGVAVVLGVYPDGQLHTSSRINWNDTKLTILEGSITKSFDEELDTNVYTGLIVVEFEEEKLGLDLKMYYKEVEDVEINIVDATVEVIEKIGVIRFTAEWEGYPVQISVAEYEDMDVKEYVGDQISEIQIGNFDNWYDFALADTVTINKTGSDYTLEGLYTSMATQVSYKVKVTASSGITTNVETTNTNAIPTILLKNGQIIIKHNDTYYNILGNVVE